MAEEGFDNKKETSDPDKDYGLPKIEIKPVPTTVTKPERDKEPLVPKAEMAVPQVELASSVEPENTNAAPEEVKKERRYGGVLVLLLFLIGIFAGGWYYYNYSRGKDEPAPSKEIATQEEQAMASDSPAKEAEPVEESVAAVAETFTLTEIQSRIDRPRYFLVVASFIDEDLAKDHAKKLHAREINTFLVFPYGEIAYYRLAIGQFENFATAAEEIRRVEDGFKENLWVLKY